MSYCRSSNCTHLRNCCKEKSCKDQCKCNDSKDCRLVSQPCQTDVQKTCIEDASNKTKKSPGDISVQMTCNVCTDGKKSNGTEEICASKTESESSESTCADQECEIEKHSECNCLVPCHCEDGKPRCNCASDSTCKDTSAACLCKCHDKFKTDCRDHEACSQHEKCNEQHGMHCKHYSGYQENVACREITTGEDCNQGQSCTSPQLCLKHKKCGSDQSANKVQVCFTNPLKKNLTNCSMYTKNAACKGRKSQIRCPRSVQAGAVLEVDYVISPGKYGGQPITVVFQSEQLGKITSTINVCA